jgi:hypothetical protein
MRYIFAVILVCALNIPEASALPTVSPDLASVPKADLFVQVAGRSRPRAHHHSGSGDGTRHRHSRRGDDGIHPLVGSGDY